MNFFETLEKKQRRTAFESSSEMAYFLDRAGLLTNVDYYAKLLKSQDPFSIIRSNIVIRALNNKGIIEDAYREKLRLDKKEGRISSEAEIKDYMALVLKDLPSFEFEGETIYVPVFTKSLNRLYSSTYHKLEEVPYKTLVRNYDASVIDAFDYYGADIFGSFFTKLILIKKTKATSAYFDYDSMSIYFVSSQGRLETKCCLFDRGLKHFSRTHMIERVVPVVDAYLEGDKGKLKKALVENKLISSRLINKINAEEQSVNRKINRIVEK